MNCSTRESEAVSTLSGWPHADSVIVQDCRVTGLIRRAGLPGHGVLVADRLEVDGSAEWSSSCVRASRVAVAALAVAAWFSCCRCPVRPTPPPPGAGPSTLVIGSLPTAHHGSGVSHLSRAGGTCSHVEAVTASRVGRLLGLACLSPAFCANCSAQYAATPFSPPATSTSRCRAVAFSTLPRPGEQALEAPGVGVILVNTPLTPGASPSVPPVSANSPATSSGWQGVTD